MSWALSVQQACPQVSSGQGSPGPRLQHVTRTKDKNQGGGSAELDRRAPRGPPCPGSGPWTRATPAPRVGQNDTVGEVGVGGGQEGEGTGDTGWAPAEERHGLPSQWVKAGGLARGPGGGYGAGASRMGLVPLPPAPTLLQTSTRREAPGCDMVFKGTMSPRQQGGRESGTVVLPTGTGWSRTCSQGEAGPGSHRLMRWAVGRKSPEGWQLRAGVGSEGLLEVGLP